MKISVKVKPGSHQSEMERTGRNEYLARVKSVPKKGKANRELLKLLADFFDVSPSRVVISRGFRSKIKIVDIMRKVKIKSGK